jgi:hypothetical protein
MPVVRLLDDQSVSGVKRHVLRDADHVAISSWHRVQIELPNDDDQRRRLNQTAAG